MEPTERNETMQEEARRLACEVRTLMHKSEEAQDWRDRVAGGTLREMAEQVLRRDYWNDVRQVTDDLRDEIEQEIRAGEIEPDGLDEWLCERLHEVFEGHARVIYTAQAIQCLLFSDNDGAFFELGDFPMLDGAPDWSAAAFWAFQADIRDRLGDLDEDDAREWLLDEARQRLARYTREECLELLGEDADDRAEDTTGDLREELAEEIGDGGRSITDIEDRRKS